MRNLSALCCVLVECCCIVLYYRKHSLNLQRISLPVTG
uniref:Uncharacterized protein n=1 Tax=Anguilla anguilla TaxID=7936 RepID=A0A0E9UP89_ANGAN